jgi:hypothetical protein
MVRQFANQHVAPGPNVEGRHKPEGNCIGMVTLLSSCGLRVIEIIDVPLSL